MAPDPSDSEEECSAWLITAVRYTLKIEDPAGATEELSVPFWVSQAGPKIFGRVFEGFFPTLLVGKDRPGSLRPRSPAVSATPRLGPALT